MSASIRILVPDETTNYIKNPALRFDTSGYVSVGSTISRTLDRARFGIASLKIITSGSAFYEGAYYRVNWLQGIQSQVTASAYVRGSGSVRIRLIEGSNQWFSETIFLDDVRWHRISVTGRCSGSNDVRLYAETSLKAQAVTFYADGFQLEPKGYPTTYCDGDQQNCSWNIVSHGSISTRPFDTRTGGRWVTLVGCERVDKNLYATVVGGLGVAPIRNNIQSYADSPGSYFQDIKVLDRVITITFHAKSPDLTRKKDVSLRDLHELRQMLFDIIKPDKTVGQEEFVIEYQDDGEPVYIKARYEAGLEGDWDMRNRWEMSFPVRFVAVAPYIFSDDQQVNMLDIKETTIYNYVLGRFDGIWRELNGGFDNYAVAFAIGKRGEIYAVGNFVRANNKATAIDPQIHANFIAYWDGSQWQQLGTGANGFINGIAIAPNGNVYVVGNFTSIGGVAANRAAMWNGSAWAAMATGLNGAGFDVKVAPNGDVYVGGSFTQAGTVPAYYCARWDGSSWHNMGLELGLNNFVNTIAISSDGTVVYLGGDFTDEFGSPGNLALNYVAEYEPLFNQFFEMGDGFDDSVYKIVLSSSNTLYACGEFLSSGAQPMLYVSYWNGGAWFGLSSGANNTVRDIDVNSQGVLLAVGDFTRIGSVDAQYAAMWNGSSWVNLDTDITGVGYAVTFDAKGNIFLSFNGTIADSAAITTVNNISTAETSPKIYILGPGTLRWIENQTTKKRVYADLNILNDEEVIVDFAQGKVISSIRSDLAYAISPGSDVRAWTLLPGQNKIAVLMDNDVDALMQISYTPRHWSADAMYDQDGV